MRIFEDEKFVGIFKGFSEGGLEFHADIILRYQNEFQNIPMHGQFLVVELEGGSEAVLGRITAVAAQGRLAGTAGEDYGIRAVTEGREVTEDLRESYVKYKIDIRVLGVLRTNGSKLEFAPSHRRLPHVGSRVAFLSDKVLREVAGHNLKNDDGSLAAEFGYLAYGEFVFSGGESQKKSKLESWMVPKNPSVITRFRIDQLVSRRSFVFARAGFGKSNLVKLLFSSLYQTTPTIKKRNRIVPVGTVIFDPDGEYFWPDDSGRPGLCDVPGLEDKIVVFTNKSNSSDFYNSFVAGSIKLDIRRLKASDIISISLPPERQTQQNVQKLKALPSLLWGRLVNLIYRLENTTPIEDLREIILGERGNDRQDAEIIAIRSNMTTIVKLLHDPSSQMMDMLTDSLRNGKLCIVDISQMRGQSGLILSGIILQHIFEHNQREFTKAEPNGIPTIAVLEEAQSVLGGKGGNEGPYINWVKEGRKFSLGAVLITQQPGSIADEILSQGDNWFIFHLLSAGDLHAVKKANAHFSNDLLSSLLNEPIPGNGIFWSSSGGKPYPIPMRVLSFEEIYPLRDKDYSLPAAVTYAATLKERFQHQIQVAAEEVGTITSLGNDEETGAKETNKEDVLEMYIASAIQKTRQISALISKIRQGNAPWKAIVQALEDNLPKTLENRNEIAYDCVPRFLNEEFGEGKWKGTKKDSKSTPGKTTSYIEIIN